MKLKSYQWKSKALKKENDKYEKVALVLLIAGAAMIMLLSKYVPMWAGIACIVASFGLDVKAYTIQRKDKTLKQLKRNNEI